MADQMNLQVQQGELLEVKREQRLSDRRLFEARAVLIVDGVTVDLTTVDISTGGLCVRSSQQLSLRKEAQVEFSLYDGVTHRLLSAPVQVVYCFSTGEKAFKAGLEFSRMAMRDTLAIKRYVAIGPALA